MTAQSELMANAYIQHDKQLLKGIVCSASVRLQAEPFLADAQKLSRALCLTLVQELDCTTHIQHAVSARI